MIRAKAFKEELSITTKLEEKIEAKDQDLLELKKTMKMKVCLLSFVFIYSFSGQYILLAVIFIAEEVFMNLCLFFIIHFKYFYCTEMCERNFVLLKVFFVSFFCCNVVLNSESIILSY